MKYFLCTKIVVNEEEKSGFGGGKWGQRGRFSDGKVGAFVSEIIQLNPTISYGRYLLGAGMFCLKGQWPSQLL